MLEMKESHRKNISGARREKVASRTGHTCQICKGNPSKNLLKTLQHPIRGFTWMKQLGPLPLDDEKSAFLDIPENPTKQGQQGFPSWWTGWHPFSLLSTTLGWAQGLLCCEMVPKMKSLTMVRSWISSKSWTLTCVSDQRDVFLQKCEGNLKQLKQYWSNCGANSISTQTFTFAHLWDIKILQFSTCNWCIQ